MKINVGGEVHKDIKDKKYGYQRTRKMIDEFRQITIPDWKYPLFNLIWKKKWK